MKIGVLKKIGAISTAVILLLMLLSPVAHAAPAAPSALTAAAISGLNPIVTLTWTDNSSNESGFHVQRSIDNFVTTDATFSAPVNAVTFPDTTILAGATYYYRVTSFDIAGDSAPSNTVAMPVPGGGAPFHLGPVFTLVQSAPAPPVLTSGQANLVSVTFPIGAPPVQTAFWQLKPATGTTGFNAFEIMAQTVPNLTPRAAAGTTITSNNTAITGPAGSVAVFAIQGVATAVSAQGEWQIGTPTMFVYESAATVVTGVPAPGVGDEVIVVGNRAMAGGPIVAQSIIRNAPAPQPGGAAIVSTSLRINGTVSSTAATSWGVSATGAALSFNIMPAPQATFIDPAITAPEVGKAVTVGFNAASGTVNKAIGFAVQKPLDVLSPRDPAPLMDDTVMPLPPGPGSIVEMNISGQITLLDLANGKWQIGTPLAPNPQVTVYESAATLIRDFPGVPAVGQGVTITAVRGVSSSPIVARTIRFSGTQPAGPAVISTSFQVNGKVTASTATSVTVTPTAGIPVVLQIMTANDPSGLGPTTTESALGATPLPLNTNVTVEYVVENGAPQPDPDPAWAAMTLNAAGTAWTATITPTAVSVSQSIFLYFKASDNSVPPPDPPMTTMVAFPATLAAAGVIGGTPPGGGGGGGGGFVTPPPAPKTVTLTGLTGNAPKVDDSGVCQEDTKVSTSDNSAILDIKSKTKMLDKDNKPITSLTVSSGPAPSQPPPNNAIVLTQNFGPDGATFVPPIPLTMKYSSLPAGANEDKLFISWWDGTKWNDLVSVVDKVAKTVTAQVPHFTSFSLIAPVPAPTTTAPVPPTTTAPAPPTTTAPAPPTVTIIPPTTTAPAPPKTTVAPPTTTAPAPSTTPPPTTTTPAPTPPASSNSWILIVGIIAAVLIVGVVIAVVARKRSAK